MNNKKSYPPLKWNNLKYWEKIILLSFLLIIFDIASINYNLFFPSFKNRSIYIVFSSIWLLILTAVSGRQELLLYFTNNLLSTTKDWFIKNNNIKQFDTLSWSYYDSKYKKKVMYSYILIGVYILFAFMFLSTKDLSFKTWTAAVVTFWIYFIWYLKSVYLQKYFKWIVDAHTTSLPHSGDINSLKIDVVGFSKKNVAAWIISGVIVLCGIILYLFKYIEIFNVVTIFWSAFLYPAVRLTIDLNIQFNRFSFTLEKITSDPSIAKDEGA